MAYTLDEIKGFEEQRRLVTQKLHALNTALILETGAAEKFKLNSEIQPLEIRKAELDAIFAEAYGLESDTGKARLREKIKDLDISGPMGRVHLINCDRKTVRDRFEAGFNQKVEMGALNHFYFLSACQTQLPPSLGERMIYEILGDLLDEGMDAVYWRFNPKNPDRVKLEALPLGYSLEKSKELFREFCARWFGWADKAEFSEAIAANRLPLAKNKYTVLPFFLYKSDWQPFFATYFDWLSEQLAARPAGGPTLLVFIVFYHENLHREVDEKSKEILAEVDAICTRHPNAGHFHPLHPVLESDLRQWFARLGEHNNARLLPVLKTLEEGLPPGELQQFQQAKELNMDRVELVQKLVYDLYNT
jgi:hypothetical protein